MIESEADFYEMVYRHGNLLMPTSTSATAKEISINEFMKARKKASKIINALYYSMITYERFLKKHWIKRNSSLKIIHKRILYFKSM